MITELQKRFDIFESKRFLFMEKLNKLTEAQLTFKPHIAHWSMLDIVQHLMLAESAFLLQVTEKTFKPRRLRFNPVIGSIIVWFVFKFGIRVKVPVKSAIPKETMLLAESTLLWNEKRMGLRGYLDTLDSDAARQKIFFHPIKGPISSIILIDFLTIHFDHHMKQVKRLQCSPHYPK